MVCDVCLVALVCAELFIYNTDGVCSTYLLLQHTRDARVHQLFVVYIVTCVCVCDGYYVWYIHQHSERRENV